MLAKRVEAHAVSIVPAVTERTVGESQFDTIGVERESGVVTVTLDRPARKNAISGTMWDELLAAFRAIADEPADRVVVVTGAGGAFCSGADLSDASSLGTHSLTNMRHVGDVCLALHRLPQPTIAKVNGVAAGAGLNLALACDLVVASTAARFSEIFSRRGLSIDFGGSWVLPRLIGLHRAKELALLAEIIDATEADRLGLVNRVVDPDELDQFVAAWAARLATGPPIALGLTKRLLNDGLGRTLAEAVEDEARAQSINFATDDTAEAISAFLHKRDPQYRGS